MKFWSKTMSSMVYLIIVMGLSGCAHFYNSHNYGVRFINHSDRNIRISNIHIGSYKGLAGGVAMPGDGGGSVSLGIRKLPNRATFWWEWGGRREPPMRADLIIPDIPKAPDNIDTYCCELMIYILPGNQVRTTVRLGYIDSAGEYRKLSVNGPLVSAVQEESVNAYY